MLQSGHLLHGRMERRLLPNLTLSFCSEIVPQQVEIKAGYKKQLYNVPIYHRMGRSEAEWNDEPGAYILKSHDCQGL